MNFAFIAGRRDWKLNTYTYRYRYRYLALFITFIAYTCYHASRKPNAIVKTVLLLHLPHPKDDTVTKGWAPFNGTSTLGEIDMAFLASYSIGMYVAWHYLGDTLLDLRFFLAIGMIGSGVFVGLFGMGYFWNVHQFWYYRVMQMVAGLFQATGWPYMVAVIGNWFGKGKKRDLVMGVWNAHTSVGNISGSLLSAAVLEFGWGWCFIAPGGLIILGGVIVWLLLVPYPEDVGFYSLDDDDDDDDDEEAPAPQATNVDQGVNRTSVGIIEACRIPGVIAFAMCLFFAKLVAYTFLYWLPFYLSRTEISGEYLSVKSAANLSTLFDVGGIFGGILAGYISDKLNARALIATSFLYAAIPSMFLYRTCGSASRTVNIVLMMVTGLFVNGPYSLITTAVFADLGKHSSLKGDSRALATVMAIIDGTGSVGAALGPFLTGFVSTTGWEHVFIMLSIGAFIAGLLLSGLVLAELTNKIHKPSSIGQQNHGDRASQPLLDEER